MAVSEASLENLKKARGFDKIPENINKDGRPKLIAEKELFEKIFAEQENGVSAIEAITTVLKTLGKEGNIKAIEIILERLYGKIKQPTDITTNGKDLIPLIQVEILKPNNDGTKENPA